MLFGSHNPPYTPPCLRISGVTSTGNLSPVTMEFIQAFLEPKLETIGNLGEIRRGQE